MEVPLCSTNPRGSERNGALYAQWTRRPFVRLAKIKHRGCAEPTTDGEVVWRKMEPGNGSSEFSAVAWCFAREVADATGIPVGIIGASVGATSIDSWIPKSHFSFKPSKRKGNDPCIYWNGMVAFLAPYSMRGIIWYQGERNSWPDEWPYYCSKMHAFHDGWKAAFGNPHLKLRFVQLAPWGSPTVPQTQCVQQQFADEEPDAAMCVINDLGNLADIHPWNKETVGRRLAALALRYDYGFTDVKADSPRVTAATATTNGMVSLTVANADKLHIYQPEWEFKQNPAATVKLGFELAGTNGVWKSARIENLRRFHAKWMKPNYSEYRGDFAEKEIVLFSPEVPEPKSVRYLFSRPWRGTVYNEARLPLGAFHVEVR
jgi:sialate O-acetylesterase